MDTKQKKRFFDELFGMHHMFFACMRGQMGHGMLHPKQGPILTILLHHEGASQAEIVREMNVSAATVAVSIARLEKQGYVTRARNENNQRANVLCLTEAGRKEAIHMQKVMTEVGQTALEGLTDKDIKIMEAYFGKMIRNLQTKYDCKENKRKPCDR